MSRRSSLEKLSPAIRDAVAAAIADGATTDEITAQIRALGGDCSRSAVARYVGRVREPILQQRESDRDAETWVNALGERAEGRSGLLAIEALRTQALDAVTHLGKRKEPLTADEIARLALAFHRIEGADRLRVERECTLAKAAAQGGGAKRGLSDDAVAVIRRAVQGEFFPGRSE